MSTDLYTRNRVYALDRALRAKNQMLRDFWMDQILFYKYWLKNWDGGVVHVKKRYKKSHI